VRGNNQGRAKRRQSAKSGLPLAPFGREIRSRKAVAELGVANLAERPRGFNERPGVGICEQRLEDEAVQTVTAATGPIGPEDGCAGKREIADGIERLVAHELVRIAETFAIDNAVVANGDGILERGAKRKTGSP